MVLSISYMKAVTATQHTFPYALGKRSVFCPRSYTYRSCKCDFTVAKHIVDVMLTQAIRCNMVSNSYISSFCCGNYSLSICV